MSGGIARPHHCPRNTKGAPGGAPFVLWNPISRDWWSEAKPMIPSQMKMMVSRNVVFHHCVILRFPNPIETKTSPKSWRRLSLLYRAGRVSMDAINQRRHQPNGDRRWFPAGSFSYFSLPECRRNGAAGCREDLGHSDPLLANSQGEHFGCSGHRDRHRYPIGRKSGGARCERDGLVGRQTGASV